MLSVCDFAQVKSLEVLPMISESHHNNKEGINRISPTPISHIRGASASFREDRVLLRAVDGSGAADVLLGHPRFHPHHTRA